MKFRPPHVLLLLESAGLPRVGHGFGGHYTRAAFGLRNTAVLRKTKCIWSNFLFRFKTTAANRSGLKNTTAFVTDSPSTLAD
jgi:hypothetical protein